MSLQHPDSQKCLSDGSCFNIIVLFNKTTKTTGSKVIEVKNTCATYLKVSSSNPKDKQFVMADENFRLKDASS
ncbi:hypothetical protein CU098_007525 [Rhizopus stolonifer]|uniref:Uncharacterized protein n=1 Tax=Rhizopus stolonifer TaxID=4846 RepID=A0A367ITS5_RHIST|nr:hypothetical protein CU098_007525 [Rhizopus stolonifer]